MMQNRWLNKTANSKKSPLPISGAWGRRSLRLVLLPLLCALVCFGGSNPAESHSAQEYEVKAVFLYNFAKFVEWSPGALGSPDEPLIIAVIGKDPFGRALDLIKDKTVGGRTILIRRFAGIEDLGKCHILFIASSDREEVSHIVRATKNLSILTVGELKGMGATGVVINFIIENSKVRFEINPDAANRAGLKISSHLLKLARIIRENN